MNNLRSFFSVVDRATRPLRAIGRSMRGMAAVGRVAAGRLRQAYSDVGLKSLVGQMKAAGNAAADFGGRLKSAFGGLSFISIGAGFAAVTASMRTFVTEGDQAAKMAVRLGTSARTLAGIEFAGERSGVGRELTRNALRTFQLRIADAARGEQSLASLFTQLGIDIRNDDGSLRGVADLLPEISEAFETNTDAVARGAIAAKLFETENVKLINLFAQGRGEYERLVAEGAAYSGMTEENTKWAEKLSDALTGLMAIVRGLSVTIGGKLAPVLMPLVESFGEWVKVNRELIALRAEVVIKELAAALKEIDWGGLWEGAKGFAHGVRDIVEFVGGWKNALVGLILLLNAGLIISFALLIVELKSVWVALGGVVAKMAVLAFTGIGNLIGHFVLLAPYMAGAIASAWAFTAALLANPLTWIVVGIVALGAGLVLLVKHWDSVTAAFKSGWDWIVSIFEAGFEKIRPIMELMQAGLSFIPGAGSLGAVDRPRLQSLVGQAAAGRAGTDGTVTTRVVFENVPPGTRVQAEAEAEGIAEPSLDVGYAPALP